MKIILTKDLENLGKAGSLVEVKRGYGRNYLLPHGLAVLATDKNVRRLEHEKAGILSRAAKHKTNMTAMAQKLSAIELSFKRKVGEAEKLFGSVTTKDVWEAIVAKGFELERKLVHLPEALKTLGKHIVEVKLHPEVTAKINVTIEAEKAE
ncbi:MAG: 50S ribosomal protein L9 [Deltaproteobacteria bacterium]|nr:50S ribosomal protein L9 [Deltaproteobacteria bacterium]